MMLTKVEQGATVMIYAPPCTQEYTPLQYSSMSAVDIPYVVMIHGIEISFQTETTNNEMATAKNGNLQISTNLTNFNKNIRIRGYMTWLELNLLMKLQNACAYLKYPNVGGSAHPSEGTCRTKLFYGTDTLRVDCWFGRGLTPFSGYGYADAWTTGSRFGFVSITEIKAKSSRKLNTWFEVDIHLYACGIPIGMNFGQWLGA